MGKKNQAFKIRPLVFSRVDSTNTIAKNTALAGAAEGTAIFAECQTAGKGRLGRSFLSKKGGIYMSYVLRPQFAPDDTLFITVAAAVAVCRAIESVCDKKCQIKWVNDVYIEGKKVCGILTEGEFSTAASLEFAILGVGINLFEPRDGFPAELPLAGSVFDKNCRILRKKRIKRRLIKAFVYEFFSFYNNLSAKEFIKEYQNRSFLNGKEITYTKDGKTLKATVLGIDDEAALIVKTDEQTQKLSFGEIQIAGMEQPPI